MPENLESSAVATGLEKVSFHSNLKEKQCQRMFKLPHSCTHFTCQQGNAQNSQSQASIVCEPRTSRCSSWIQEMVEEPEITLPIFVGSQKKKENSRKNIYFYFIDNAKDSDQNKLWKILKEMGIPEHLTYLLKNLYFCKSRSNRTKHSTKDWFQIWK